MSFLPVIEYIAGFFTFGLTYLLGDDIINSLRVVSATGNVFQLGLYLWAGLLVVYIIGGAFWLWKKYTQPAYNVPYDFGRGF